MEWVRDALAGGLALPVAGAGLGVWISERGMSPSADLTAWGALALGVSVARLAKAAAQGPLGDQTFAVYSTSWLPRARMWRVPLETALAGLLAGSYPGLSGRVAQYRASNPWYNAVLKELDDVSVAELLPIQSALTGFIMAAPVALLLFWSAHSWVTLPDVLGEGGPRPISRTPKDATRAANPRRTDS